MVMHIGHLTVALLLQTALGVPIEPLKNAARSFLAPTLSKGSRMSHATLAAIQQHRKQDGMPEVAWRAFQALAEEKRQLLEAGSTPGAHPAHPEVRGSVFEAVEISMPLVPPIIKHDPAFGAGQGDKNIVGINQMTHGGHHCVVYGLGIANDPGFEEQMQSLGCETHAFDCTVRSSNPVVAGKAFQFHEWCIGQRGKANFTDNVYAHGLNTAILQFKTLAETMRELGHTYVDILKFDIEGFEWKLFESEILPSSNPPEQLSFELHTQKANPAYVPHQNVADKGYVQVNSLFKSLYDRGYRVASKELNSGDPACAEFVVLNVNKH